MRRIAETVDAANEEVGEGAEEGLDTRQLVESETVGLAARRQDGALPVDDEQRRIGLLGLHA